MERDALPIAREHCPLNDQVYGLLKTEILCGHLRSGQRLPIVETADRLGVSTTPVRDALRKLAEDGLVSIIPRSGTYVSEFTPQQVHEVFQSRRIVECAAIECLPACTAAQIARMRDLLAEEKALLGAPTFEDYQRRLALDDEFHHCIVELLRNSRIERFYEALRWPLQVTRGLLHSNHDRANGKVREHRAILQAMERGDAAAAKDVLLRHLSNAETHLVDSMSAASAT
jgi:DNA-binding GntR family transcriptional regulator